MTKNIEGHVTFWRGVQVIGVLLAKPRYYSRHSRKNGNLLTETRVQSSWE